jgi:lipid-binding SYLF domain-containing protein
VRGYDFAVANVKGFTMRLLSVGCFPAIALAAVALAWPSVARAQLTSGQAELQTVNSARETLDEFGGLAIESIPPAMFTKAEGVAIFPDMIKGGFILGVNFGRGVLLVRRPDRTWSPPVMVTMGGGSLGFQAGVQSADIVLVFATPRSLNGILNGQKVTLGADASVALGPVGRQANAGTDARLGAEIYSYARSRGLFLGVSINGADLSVDNNANAMLYGRFGVTPADVFAARGLAFHNEVKLLIDDLNARSQLPTVQVPAPQPGVAVQPTVGTVPVTTPQQPMPVVQPQPLAPIQPPPPTAPVTGATDAPYAPPASIPPLVPIR